MAITEWSIASCREPLMSENPVDLVWLIAGGALAAVFGLAGLVLGGAEFTSRFAGSGPTDMFGASNDTMITSARLPGVSEPIWLSSPRQRAPPIVASSITRRDHSLCSVGAHVGRRSAPLKAHAFQDGSADG
jgi:hypothetical protein